jgi:alpha-L-arabinofuranosidase
MPAVGSMRIIGGDETRPNRAHLGWSQEFRPGTQARSLGQELRPVHGAGGMDAEAWTRLVEWFNFDCETRGGALRTSTGELRKEEYCADRHKDDG